MTAIERWRPSITVAAIVEDRGRYLLVEEDTAAGLRLNNPAGHLEPGESPQQGVVREALEETARRFEPQALVGVYLARVVGADSGPGSGSGSGSDPDPDLEPDLGRLARAGTDVTYLRFAYCGSVGEPLPGRALDSGIVRTLWLTADEVRASAARHRSPLVLRGIEDHLAGRRFPLDLVHADASVAGLLPKR